MSGSCLICSDSIVEVMADDSTGAADPATSTVSLTVPTCITTLTLAGVAVVTRMRSSTIDLKRARETATLYGPGSSAGTLNNPASFVTTAGRLTPVALLVTNE